MRTIPDISNLLLPLDKAIDEFTEMRLQNRNISKTDRDLISIPAKMGGLGIIIPSKVSNTQYQNSISVTKQLIQYVKAQKMELVLDEDEIKIAKSRVKVAKAVINRAMLADVKSRL